MPFSQDDSFMESISALLQKISSLREEKAIAEQAIPVIHAALPAGAYAVLRMTDRKHRAVVLSASGGWRNFPGRNVHLPQRFLEANVKPMLLPPEETPLLSTDPEPKIFYAIPLTVSNKTWGYAFALFISEISPSALNFLGIAFSCMAEAMLGANLTRRVEQFRLQMELLTSVERAVNSSLTLSVTQSVLLDACMRLLEADAAALWVMEPQERGLSIAAARGFHGPFPSGEQGGGEENLARRAQEEHHLVIQTDGDLEREGTSGHFMRQEKFHFGYAAPLLARSEVKGVLEIFLRSEEEPSEEWLQMLEALTTQAAVAVDHALVFSALERASIQLSITCDAAISAFIRAADLRALEGEEHSRRVADLTVQMAEKARIPAHHLVHIRRGALLHDIGKIGMPDSVLWKPGSFNEQDWEWMHRHPQFAADILQSLEVLQPAMIIPQYHHERWDGSGYPYGLAGSQIPLAARLFSVVDCWDSMLARRSYREPLGRSEAAERIRQGANNQFDPDAVRIFLGLIEEFEDPRRID